MDTPRRMPVSLTRFAFVLVVLIPALLPLAWGLKASAFFAAWWGWVPLVVLYGLLPVLDGLIGRDPAPVADSPAPDALQNRVPVAAAVSYTGVLAWSLWLLGAHGAAMSPFNAVGWVVSLGSVGGVAAINVAHELIHRRDRRLQRLGAFLLTLVWYPSFRVEHLRWHHVWVATDEDPSSAPRGATAWRHVPVAMARNVRRAWRLAIDAARRAGRPWPVLNNELVPWYGLGLALLVAVGLAWGPLAALAFVAQGLLAAGLLEVINFIEHYGLRRERRAGGGYVRPSPAHSWNADFWLSNAILIELQRHSDHHAHPARPFTRLRSLPEAPQLPMSYAALVPIALVPPLWRRVMHPHLPAEG